MNAVVEYLKSEGYVDVNELRKLFMIDYKTLSSIMDEFNQKSFYYKISIVNNVVYLEDKNLFENNRQARLRILRDVWLSGVYQMDDLELIFGRSKKTLYKDIKRIKEEIIFRYKNRDCSQLIFYHQILNEFNYEVMHKICTENISPEKLYTNVANNIFKIIGGRDITKIVVIQRIGKNVDFAKHAQMLTTDLINNIERYLKKKIIRTKIYDQLLVHIESSYWRYKYMVFRNTIDMQQVINSNLYEYYQISMIIEMILRSHNLYCSTEEIMYIALYFLNPDIYQNLNVKINVKRGSQYVLVQKELNKHFQDFNIVVENADIIITLEMLELENMIQVKIPFDVYDIRNLSRYLSFKQSNISSQNLFVKLKPLLKKTVTYEQFTSSLTSSLLTKNLSLNQFLTPSYIIIENIELNWEQAIKKAAKILEDKMYINENYIDSIIQLVKKYNAEIVITKGIALAHAPVTSDVLQSGFSFLYSKKPIIFAKNKPVYLIILFCASTEVDMLLALQQLNSVLTKKTVLSKLKAVETKAQLIKLLTPVAKIK